MSGQNVLLASKNRTYLALGANVGFTKSSCGYVGTSDGWQDLSHNFQLDWEFDRAEDGNVALIGQIDFSHCREFTIGLAFGDGQHAAVTALMQSLGVPFDQHRKRFVEQWRRVANIETLDKYSGDDGRLYRVSHNLLLAHEDKTFAGALIASASIPWGRPSHD